MHYTGDWQLEPIKIYQKIARNSIYRAICSRCSICLKLVLHNGINLTFMSKI